MPAADPAGRGVLYVATGAAHVAAARRSAASVRRTNPGLAIAVFCDAAEPGPEFDRVQAITDPHARSKVDCLPRTPFAETLYLDSDTRVLGDLGDLFRLLERFDLAAAHRVRDTARVLRPQAPPAPPSAFPEHNGGVLLYRSRPEVLAFLTAWRDAYRATGSAADQISFRRTLWTSDIRVAVLPPRYNTRRHSWLDAWFSSAPPPVILHANRFHPSKRGGRLKRRLGFLAGPGGA